MSDSSSPPKARRTMRLSTSFVLESLRLLRRTTHLELLTAIVFLQILDANAELIAEFSEADGRFQEAQDIPGNDLRQPVSVYTLAHELDMPYETVRRHVQILIEKGLCRRLGNRGVIAPTETLLAPAMLAAVEANAANVEALVEAVLDPRSERIHFAA